MTFWLGDQFYAIEHTGIEPFDGFMKHQNRAPDLFRPLKVALTYALSGLLSPGTVIEMHLPIDAFNGPRVGQVPSPRAARTAVEGSTTSPSTTYLTLII